MPDVKWIKITTSMFDDEKIKLIEALPEADTILIIWVKLLCLAGKTNASGYIFLAERMPYTEEMLSTLFNRQLNVVRLALNTFERFGMIETNQQGIYLVNWQKHQSIDKLEQIREQNRLRKQAERQRKALPDTSSGSHDMSRNASRDCHVTVTGCHATDLDIDLEKDLERDLERGTVSPAALSPASPDDYIITLYHSLAPSLPRISKLSKGRMKAIKARQRTYPDTSIFAVLFQKAEESDFLSGRNRRWTSCNFDWLITESNMLRVLEGTYDNKPDLSTTDQQPSAADDKQTRYRPNVARALDLVEKARKETEKEGGG